MEQARLTENPWFWLMLFGCLGAAGVVVIGPKHAARQARLERMAEAREQVKAARGMGINAAELKKVEPDQVAASSAAASSAATSSAATSSAATTGPMESPSASGATVGGTAASGTAASGTAASGTAASGTAASGTAAGSTAGQGPIEPYVDADFRRRPQLAWLLGLMIVLMLTGTAGMILSRRRQAA